MAAALLRGVLEARLGPRAAAEVRVASAGLDVAAPGEPATDFARRAMAERGLSLAGHRARQLGAADLADADLILTMTRQHKQQILRQYPSAADHLFTLCEFSRGDAAGAGDGADRDIADPIGGDIADYRACAAELAEELSRLVELMYGGEGSSLPTMEIAAPPEAPVLRGLPLAAEPRLRRTAVRRLAAGADHAGFELKSLLVNVAKELGADVVDYGTNDAASCDYPDFAAKVAAAVADGTCDAGLLVCGTGLGMAIAANKVRGIRAVTVNDLFSARLAREHNDANVACIGARIVGPGLAAEVVRTFLTTPWAGDRHARRLLKIHDLEQTGKEI
jgi:ribose 5-phosphate isomerase B